MMDGSWKHDNLNVYRSHSMLDWPQEMLRAGHGARTASCALQWGWQVPQQPALKGQTCEAFKFSSPLMKARLPQPEGCASSLVLLFSFK